MALSHIRRLLPGAAHRAGITRDLVITAALRACQDALAQIFGAEYSKFAEPVAVRPDGALIISCRSPAVAQTIRLREAEILRGVRATVRQLHIERLLLIPRSAGDVRAVGR